MKTIITSNNFAKTIVHAGLAPAFVSLKRAVREAKSASGGSVSITREDGVRMRLAKDKVVLVDRPV